MINLYLGYECINVLFENLWRNNVRYKCNDETISTISMFYLIICGEKMVVWAIVPFRV